MGLWETSGRPQTEVAAELGIVPTMLRRWQRKQQESSAYRRANPPDEPPLTRSESMVELTYSDRVTSFLTLQPDIQYVHRPSGLRGAPGVVDAMLPGSLMANNMLYAGGADLADPYLSPLFDDVAGFPPTFLLTGTRDLFLSNTARMHRHLLAAGVSAELNIFEAMPHGGFGGTPEDREAAREVKRFVRQQLGLQAS